MQDPQSLLTLLSRISARLAKLTTLEELAQGLQAVVGETIELEYFGCYLLDQQSGKLRLLATYGFSDEERREAERTALDRHPGWVLRTGQRFHVEDAAAEAYQVGVDSKRRAATRSRLYLPILSEGQCVGMLGLSSPRAHAYSELHISTMDFACNVAGILYKSFLDAEERARQLQQLRVQQDELRLLGSPVLEIWPRTLALPIIGTLDAERATLISEKLLTGAIEKRARIVILDLTGLRMLEEGSIVQIVRIIHALRLVGSRCVLSGISPQTAKLLALSAQDLDLVQTFSTVQQALAMVIQSTPLATAATKAR